MNSKNRRNEDAEFDSWDRTEQAGFLKKLQSGYRRWRENRRLIAEERQSLKEFQQSQSSRQAPTKSVVDAPGPKRNAATTDDRETGRMLQKGDLADFQSRSWYRIWREERQLRKEIIARQKADRDADDPLARRKVFANASGAEFGIGDAGSFNSTGQARAMHWASVRKIGAKIWELRIPQWLLGMAPALVFIFFVVIPSLSELHDRYVAHTRLLEKKLPRMIEQKQWQEASFVSHRVFDCSIASLDDYFDYFQIQKELGHNSKAWDYLQNQVNSVNTLDKGQYHLRLAEEILKNNPSNQVVNQVVVGQLKDAINNPLSETDSIKARQILARIYAAIGDLVGAYKVLEPVQSRDVTIAADILWLRFNLNDERSLFEPKVLAQRLMGDVDKLVQATDPLTDREIGSKVRLMMLTGKEPELRRWIAAQSKLSENLKIKWSKEIDKMSLAGEFKKVPIQYAQLWAKLGPFLVSEPDSLLWQQIAVNIWALPEKERIQECYNWVEQTLNSDKASDDILKMAAMSSHVTAQWEKSRRLYEAILKRRPNDVSALNNLAGIYYKVPPYDLNKALALSNQANDLAPDNPGLLETKGQILARQGKIDEAQAILERCLVSFPEEWNLHNTLAQIYETKGQLNLARTHRERMSKLKKPSNAPLQDSIADKAK